MNSSEFMRGISVCPARKALKALGLAMMLLLFCLPIFSQTSQGTIQGRYRIKAAAPLQAPR